MSSSQMPISSASTASAPRPRRHGRLWRIIRHILLTPLFALAIAWGTLAIYYSNAPAWIRPYAAGTFAAASLAILMVMKSGWRIPAFASLFAAVAIWWALIPASNNRDWEPDMAVLPWAQVSGDRVTVHNIRLCDYRGERDFDVHYHDRTFDLKTLHAADVLVVTWGSPHIAHTMMSFAFANDEYLCFSIETRKEKGEAYSVIKGFFKQYELMYVAADERDLVRLRTNFRNEQVSVYRAKAAPDVVRAVFLGYLKAMNSLRDRPEWYNALTSNCLTNIRGHTLPYAPNKHWDWRFLLNGHLDELMYERGSIDTSLPFAELKARSLINAKAKSIPDDAQFSRRIRQGLPGMESPVTTGR
jgi:hypothetical protein